MSLYAVLDFKIINIIGLRGNEITRFPDYPITTELHKLRDCIKYDEIEQLILKNIYPRIKFFNSYDLEIHKQRYYRSSKYETIRNDWNQSIRIKKQY